MGLSVQGSSLGPGLGLADPPTVASAVRASAGVLSPSITSVFPTRLMDMEAPPRAAPDLRSVALGGSALCRTVMGWESSGSDGPTPTGLDGRLHSRSACRSSAAGPAGATRSWVAGGTACRSSARGPLALTPVGEPEPQSQLPWRAWRAAAAAAAAPAERGGALFSRGCGSAGADAEGRTAVGLGTCT